MGGALFCPLSPVTRAIYQGVGRYCAGFSTLPLGWRADLPLKSRLAPLRWGFFCPLPPRDTHHISRDRGTAPAFQAPPLGWRGDLPFKIDPGPGPALRGLSFFLVGLLLSPRQPDHWVEVLLTATYDYIVVAARLP